MDLPEAKDNFKAFERHFGRDTVLFPTSGKNGVNLRPLLEHVRLLYDQHEAAKSASEDE